MRPLLLLKKPEVIHPPQQGGCVQITHNPTDHLLNKHTTTQTPISNSM